MPNQRLNMTQKIKVLINKRYRLLIPACAIYIIGLIAIITKLYQKSITVDEAFLYLIPLTFLVLIGIFHGMSVCNEKLETARNNLIQSI